ncbi:siderophore-interacting protein [Microbacterium sp. cx-55]|uniref:siderophore-interacting protein n=1 Tax=Microbacterium sp. cx-55 TaxID=2875948 RepID=UPI001CBB51E8|nr:siderophore-interacting protein [Microbacterium sp. cx-55]UGB36535.1 siderophore-interacting protein [Microbacterium sp. cx-55]
MTTLSATRPAYRPYLATVMRVNRLSPSFVRITFTSPQFTDLGTAGLDQRVKILFPGPDGTVCDVGQTDPEAIAAAAWYDRWRALPLEARTPFRTYTVRRAAPDALELDIDFVLHHEPGPAGAWADAAAPGDELVIVGPDGGSEDWRLGIDWHPGTARRLLLAGDETAAPAICSILESLDADHLVDAFIEVPGAADVLPVSSSANLRWLPRGERAHGEALIEAVSAWADASRDVLTRAGAPAPQTLEEIDVDVDMLWDSPEDAQGEFYAWMAGESATVKTLRRLLVTAHGVDRRRVAFMGYWRKGLSERTG